MNDFVEFKEKYFNNDEDAALKQLAYESYSTDYKFSGNKDNLQKILDSLDTTLADRHVEYIAQEIKKNPKKYQEIKKVALNLTQMNLSYEEVKNAEVNPFKAKINKKLLISLVSGTGLIALTALLAQNSSIAGIVPLLVGGLGAYVSCDIGLNLVNYFTFKKTKKLMNKLEQEKMGLESEGKVL